MKIESGLKKLEIKFMNIKDYNKDLLRDQNETKLCHDVAEENANMVVIAWCHSLNGGDSFYQ